MKHNIKTLNDSDSDSSIEGGSLSPKGKKKNMYLRLLNTNY